MIIFFMFLVLLPILVLYILVLHFRLKNKFDILIDYLGTNTDVLSDIDKEFWEDYS